MKKTFCSLGLFVFMLSTSVFAENGKWLDYGNGIINLNSVNMITTFEQMVSGCDGKTKYTDNSKGFLCSMGIKFDKFSLTRAQYTIGKDSVHMEDQYEDATESLSDTMEEIRDFLDDDDTYLMLD